MRSMYLAPFVVAILFIIPSHVAVNAHREKCTLYTFTFPIQEHCVILSHPNAAHFNAQQYQAGLVAGKKAASGINFTPRKCQSHNKDFCLGWNQTACNSSGCGGDYTIP